MSIRSTVPILTLLAALTGAQLSFAKGQNKAPTPLPNFSNRTMNVLNRLGISDFDSLRGTYYEMGRFKFSTIPGLGHKGLTEIESAIGTWSGDPELRPLAELGLSKRVLLALEMTENTKTLQDLKSLYQKFGHHLKNYQRLGESGLLEIENALELSERPAHELFGDDANITTVGLSNRATNALWHKGIRSLGQLKQYYSEHGRKIKDMPGLGPKCLAEIEEFLGIDPNTAFDRPKLSPRTLGKLNDLGVRSLKELTHQTLAWFRTHFREKGVREILRELNEKYGFTPYVDELHRAVQEKLWNLPLNVEALGLNWKTLKFMGFETLGDLYEGYRTSSAQFLRYEQQFDPEIRRRLALAEGNCAHLLMAN